MNNMKDWIKHLQHPLVLAGFALSVMAAAFKLVAQNSNLSGGAMEHLLDKGMTFVFILALLAVVGGFVLSWRNSATAADTERHIDDDTAAVSVEQTTHGDKSPSVKAEGDVNINYGE
jgi:hypothetical protein